MKMKILTYLLLCQQVKQSKIAIKMQIQMNRKKKSRKLFPDVCASTPFTPDDGLISLNKIISGPGTTSRNALLISVK